MIKYVNGKATHVPHGMLAKDICKLTLELTVCHSDAGYYLGTVDEGGPVSRESLQYWSDREAAEEALLDPESWNQLDQP